MARIVGVLSRLTFAERVLSDVVARVGSVLLRVPIVGRVLIAAGVLLAVAFAVWLLIALVT